MSGAQGGTRSRASAQDRGGTGVVPSAIGRLALVAITLGLVIPARAAYVVWYGNGSAPFYWDDTENLRYNSGTASNPSWKAFNFQKGYNWNINEGVMKNLNGSKFSDNWDRKSITFRTFEDIGSLLSVTGVGTSEAPLAFISTDGSESYGINASSKTITLNGSTYLDIRSGRYVFDSCKFSDTATLVLSGGTLDTKNLAHQGTGSKNLLFNGGTLKAADDSASFLPAFDDLAVTVGENGGTIDADGHSITIGEDLSGAGFMRFGGGGTVTLVGEVSYSGKTYVAAGTTLAVSNSTSKANILGNGLVVRGAPALNTPYTVFVCEDVLSDGDLANVACDIASASTVAIGADGKSIVVTCTAYRAGYWIGGASGSLGTSANWSDGVVPSSGTAVIDSWATAALTNPEGSAFSPASISFPEGSALIAISGDGAISGLSAITNNAAKHHVFNVPVSFSGGATASISMAGANYMDFAGGVTMADIAVVSDAMFKGRFTINRSGDFTLNVAWTVMSGSELNYPNVVWYSHNGRLIIESNATVRVKGTKMTGSSGTKRLINKNDGVFIATNELFSSSTSASTYMVINQGDGVFVANKIRVTGVLIPPEANCKTILGPDGIIHGESGYVRIHNSGVNIYFGSYADWQIYYNSHSNTNTTLKGLKKTGTGNSTVTFDTTDYYDSTIRRTITAESGIGGSTASTAAGFGVVVQGIGCFVFANKGTNDCDFAAGLTVKDSATVAVKPGARPGRGTVTMNGTSTLEVAESGTVALGGNLTLGADAALAFNITVRNSAPVLSIPPGSTLPETVNVKISKAADLERVGANTYVLTSDYDFTGKTVNIVDKPDWVQSVTVNADGNLALAPKYKGFMVIVK